MSQAANACTTNVVLFARAANDNLASVRDPRWMQLMKLLAGDWPSILPVIARARDAGDSYEHVLGSIIQHQLTVA